MSKNMNMLSMLYVRLSVNAYLFYYQIINTMT